MIASPCLKICTVDPERDVCNGCHRTLDEIARWGAMSDTERQQVLALLPARRQSVRTLAD